MLNNYELFMMVFSFMGGTNFWGGTKEDDCFLAPSFDDRILEVVAVFGSVQMAASRLINLQHHRIAQCQTVQITILGEENWLHRISYKQFQNLLIHFCSLFIYNFMVFLTTIITIFMMHMIVLNHLKLEHFLESYCELVLIPTLLTSDHVERKVPKYEYHKIRERKVKTLTRN